MKGGKGMTRKLDRFPHALGGNKTDVFGLAKLHILTTVMTVMTLHDYDEGHGR